MPRQNAYETLKERGFVRQVTDEDALSEAFAQKQITAYVGFDPTAASLHVGNLLGLMALAHLQRAGHRPIAVIGDGTAMIGDPSGKTELRKMMTREQILANAERVKAQVGRYFRIDGENGFAVHNADWLLKLKYVDFMREIGRHFSVNRMLTAEAYRIRMETGLSFLEFNYQILQAYDFLKLYQSHNCTLQMGGDDQWGNIVAGTDLVRRVEGGKAEGLTWPLLTTASGQKMGKTAAGAVWLDAEMTSPYDYYQFWVNCDDPDVGRFLAYYTFLPMSRIAELAQLKGADIRKAKEALAFEATKITHGETEATKAQAAAKTAFGGSGEDLSGIPTTKIPTEQLRAGVFVSDLFAQVGLTGSKGEARRLIKQGGAYVNQTKVEHTEAKVEPADFTDGALMLRAGKKRFHRLLLQ